MRGTFSIGELFGIPIRMHWSLVALLVLWMALAPDMAEGLRGVIIVMLVFGSVLVHELGHALVARRFGVSTNQIMLMPLGGMAMLNDRPNSPREEFIIAGMGPATSLALAGIVYLAYTLAPSDILKDLFEVNVLLGLFNLLPAFPLDGGRMLRAGLQVKVGPMRATRLAARIGRVIAAAGFVIALWQHELLIGIIAIFIYSAGAAEEKQQLLHGMVSTQSIFTVMQRISGYISAGIRVDEALVVMASNRGIEALPVVFGERVIGIVHRKPIIMAAAQGQDSGINAGISSLVDRNVITHEGDGPLMPLLMRMQETQCHAAIITDQDRITGIITLERLADAFKQVLNGGEQA